MTAASPFDLTGAVAVVTGASRGIGLAMAESLAAAGADIVAVSATIPSTGSEVARRVAAHGRSCEPVACDFSDRAAVIALGDALAARHVGILVNNAGTIERAPAVDHPLEAWDRVLEVDLSSPFVLTQRVVRPMLERGRGRILFTASLLSFQGGITVPGNAAAKSGIAGITRALSNEWGAPRGDGQRDRPGVHRHGQHPGAAGRPGALRRDPRADPRGAVGRIRPISAARPCSSPRARRTTSPASSSPSTEGGSDDDRRPRDRAQPHRGGAHGA